MRNSSLRTVVQALRAASIEHFLVPGFTERGSVLAVREADRSRVSAALVDGLAARPPQVTQILPRPRTLQSDIRLDDRRAAESLREARVLRLHWLVTDDGRAIVLGPSFGVEIEYWAPSEWREGVHTFADLSADQRASLLNAPRPNRVARTIAAEGRLEPVDALVFSRVAGPHAPATFEIPTREEFLHPLPDEVRFPIDVVFTWVDGSDPEWLRTRAAYTPTSASAESASPARYVNRDELRFALRSLHANAPWVNHIYIVTAGQRPSWLGESDRVTVLDHREIFADTEALPVFNSHAIEANIHRIPGLSEHFLYFNDDMFIGRPIAPNAFFQPNGLAKFFPSASRVNMLPPGPMDTPVESATKNVRRLLQRDFGVVISQVMEHAPYPLRRSVLEEMAHRYADAFALTSRARFRSATDVNTLSNFAHHYAYQTARAVPASIAFTYIGLSIRDLGVRLERLLARRDTDAFCLNDTFSDGDDVIAQLEIVRPFLEAYFPVRAPWERG